MLSLWFWCCYCCCLFCVECCHYHFNFRLSFVYVYYFWFVTFNLLLSCCVCICVCMWYFMLMNGLLICILCSSSYVHKNFRVWWNRSGQFKLAIFLCLHGATQRNHVLLPFIYFFIHTHSFSIVQGSVFLNYFLYQIGVSFRQAFWKWAPEYPTRKWN